MTLFTDHLILVPADFPILDATVRADWPALSDLLGGVDIAENWTHFPEALAWMRDHIAEFPGEIGLWAYFIIHRTDVRLIGTAGYKGFPDPEGYLEIGYEIADAYQGQGLATELARKLTEFAFEINGVNGVRAHTLAAENASVGVLRKLGYRFLREKYDAEDGWIWEWVAPVT